MKALKLLLAVSMIPLLFGCKKNKDTIYEREGNTIKFGYYPQTLETKANKLETLNEKIGNLPTRENSNGWKSYNYYIADEVVDYMWYIDINLYGDVYRGVYFDSYRPFNTNLTSTDNNSCQFYCGFEPKNVYWFKYEIVEWTILEKSKGNATIVSNLAIDSQEYYPSIKRGEIDHDGVMAYANNYELSHIRKWLNDDFYNTTFNDIEKTIINDMVVNNSTSEDDYLDIYKSNDTIDKVCLLSKDEAFKYFDTKEKRQIGGTAYARCMGLNSPVEEAAMWLFRTPYGTMSNYVLFVTYEGAVTHTETNSTYIGIRPVINIKL